MPASISIPRLAIKVEDGFEIFEESHFLEKPFRLIDADAELSEAEFPLVVAGTQSAVLDVSDTGRITIGFSDQIARQLALIEGEPGWTSEQLAVWIDRRIAHPDVPQAEGRAFVLSVVDSLRERAGVTIAQLAREKYRLRTVIERRIASLRSSHREQAFQHTLFDAEAGDISVGDEFSLVVSNSSGTYEPYSLYTGPVVFKKHMFPVVGEMEDETEDALCAIHLDNHPSVAVWVRNLAKRPHSSFWLPTAGDRYYPDFVGQLTDGRVFCVENKGGHLWEKASLDRKVGNLWATASGGRCVHVMVRDRQWSVIDAAFAPVGGS